MSLNQWLINEKLTIVVDEKENNESRLWIEITIYLNLSMFRSSEFIVMYINSYWISPK